MLQFLRERRAFFLLLAILSSLFVLMAIQVRQDGPTGSDSFALRLVAPLLRAVSAVTGSVSGLWQEYVDLRRTRSRNASLEEKLALLELELQKMREADLENGRLRSLLELKETMPVRTVAARVVANHSNALSHTILVDRGSDSGLRPNMPVVSAQGVVGRVWTVSPKLSKVQLVTDSAAGTAVLVQRSRVQGIMVGRGSGICSLEYVSTLDDVREKDLVVTSGLEGIYLKGLPVGVVAVVGPREGLMRQVSVVPRVEFDRLEEVLVILTPDQAFQAPADPAGGPPR